MMAYWYNLNDRERWIALAGVVAFLMYGLYSFIYSPLVTQTMEKRRELQEKTDTLVWMKAVQFKSPNKKQSMVVSNSKLLSVISAQLGQAAFAKCPHQIRQTSQGDIQLSFESVPYTAFLTWLWTLENTYSVSLKQLEITRTPTNGLVKTVVLIDANP